MRRLLEQRDSARKKVEAAFRLNEPAYALFYRDGLRNLLQLELQLDAVCFTFEIRREELYEWVANSEKEIKELEKSDAIQR